MHSRMRWRRLNATRTLRKLLAKSGKKMRTSNTVKVGKPSRHDADEDIAAWRPREAENTQGNAWDSLCKASFLRARGSGKERWGISPILPQSKKVELYKKRQTRFLRLKVLKTEEACYNILMKLAIIRQEEDMGNASKHYLILWYELDKVQKDGGMRISGGAWTALTISGGRRPNPLAWVEYYEIRKECKAFRRALYETRRRENRDRYEKRHIAIDHRDVVTEYDDSMSGDDPREYENGSGNVADLGTETKERVKVQGPKKDDSTTDQLDQESKKDLLVQENGRSSQDDE
ncbi:hypothetical protein FQA39_LY13366 [Lamprigera yunnana]|nr:hypothetical protein FQA39_LY13366 [Lamprigera yunnana]